VGPPGDERRGFDELARKKRKDGEWG